jgi:hypothetical protein
MGIDIRSKGTEAYRGHPKPWEQVFCERKSLKPLYSWAQSDKVAGFALTQWQQAIISWKGWLEALSATKGRWRSMCFFKFQLLCQDYLPVWECLVGHNQSCVHGDNPLNPIFRHCPNWKHIEKTRKTWEDTEDTAVFSSNPSSNHERLVVERCGRCRRESGGHFSWQGQLIGQTAVETLQTFAFRLFPFLSFPAQHWGS